MFSLIITIISIALVAGLAIATLYYGGSAFTEGNTRASASAVINQAQQIAGAATLYSVQKAEHATDIAQLEPDYLSSLPVPPATVSSGSWALDVDSVTNARVVTIDLTSADVCDKINDQAGAGANPADITNLPYVCVSGTDVDPEGGPDITTHTFQYRY